MNTRAIATQLIHKVLTDRHSLSEVLPEFKTQCKDAQEAALVQAMCFGVLRTYPRLTFIVKKLLQKPLKQKEIILHYLICVGLYQLIEMRIPDHAAISETVEAARLLEKPWATGLINAVLRTYLRQAETLQKEICKNQEAHYAHPLWLLKAIQHAWPEWESIIKANNEHPPLSIRVNIQKISREDYLASLLQHQCTATAMPHSLSGIMIDKAQDITALPGFKEGYFSVQDGASQLVAPLLNLKPGLRVLDACSAPGGKTAHMLELEPNLSEVMAVDLSRERIQLIKDNLNRLQLKATVLHADASKPSKWWDGQLFDRILLDAPCSASGIIRRHPDIKYLRRAEDIIALSQQQLCLLQALWPLLKPNGILVYTTCSILPEENRMVMGSFLNQCDNASSLPFELPLGLKQTIGHQILPGQNGFDGFYYARILKI